MALKPKSRLGRGLSSLISIPQVADEPVAPAGVSAPSASPAPSTEARPAPSLAPATAAPEPVVPGVVPTTIPVVDIRPNPHQPRRTFNEASLAELAASIGQSGLIQPVVVRKVAKGYELVAGERRLRAAKLAGIVDIPAIVREADEVTQAEWALIENIQREDLNPIDRARGYRTLMEKVGLTQVELASRLGEDRSSIANFLRLLDLSEPVRELVRDGGLSLGHAKILAGIDDPAEQERLAQLVQDQQLSVRNLEQVIKQGPPAEPSDDAIAPAQTKPSAHLQELEQTITRQLGMRVQLRTGRQKGKGRLVIHYHSLDQFDELVQKLGVQLD